VGVTDDAEPGGRGTGLARWAIVAIGLILAYLVLLWVDGAPRGHLSTGDTNVLVAGARKAADCIHLDIWRSCDARDPGGGTVAPFPLLQYLPVLAMIKLHLPDVAILRVLARINVSPFGTTMLLALVALRADRSSLRRWLAPLAVAAVLASSAVYQATSGFGEMLAATAALAAITAAAWRRPLLVAPAVAVACLGKETLFPFVVALCVLIARRGAERLPPWRTVLSIGLGALAGVAVNVLFNQFRYGTYRNGAYLMPKSRTPGLWRKVEYAAGGWFSPSAGIAWFWPIATGLLLTVLVLSLVALVRRRPWHRWLPPLLAVGVAVAMVAGLAFWYSPFGWLSYGPRLAVPILPAAVVVATSTGAPLLGRAIRTVFARRHRPDRPDRPAGGARIVPIVLAALLLAAMGWPQYGVPWNWQWPLRELSTKDSVCPGIMHAPIEQDKALYYRCVSDVMWRLHPATLDDAASRGVGPVAAARVTAAAATLALAAGGLAAVASIGSRQRDRKRRCELGREVETQRASPATVGVTGVTPPESADLAEPDGGAVGGGGGGEGAAEAVDVERQQQVRPDQDLERLAELQEGPYEVGLGPEPALAEPGGGADEAGGDVVDVDEHASGESG
jgi:hypothetical protein